MTNKFFNPVILDTDFKAIYTLDEFESFIWTERYSECGDFELYTLFSQELLSVLKPDYYILNRFSEYVMIIEDIKIETDSEDGSKLIVSGRSLESILSRRIVWTQTEYNGKLEVAVEHLLNTAIISPVDEKRQIKNFIFKPSGSQKIENCILQHQYTGDNIYDVICEICEEFSIGFKITLDKDWNFVFQFYSGVDRTDFQFNNRKVIFSPKMDNLFNSNYEELRTEWKTVALVAGEGEGLARKMQIAGDETITGLYRRELFVDARSRSSNSDPPMSDAQYYSVLKDEGNIKLAEHRIEQNFDGEGDHATYDYQKDYGLGDLIELENEYGIKGLAQITEFIFSFTDGGSEFYPSFSAISKEFYTDITSEKLTPKMLGLGDLTTTGQVTGTDWLRNGDPETYAYNWFRAFDEDLNTFWITPTANFYINKPDWVQFQWPNGERVVPTHVKGYAGFTTQSFAAKKVEVYVENDLGDMILVGSEENTIYATTFAFNIYLTEEVKTNKVRIVVYSAFAYYTALREVEIFGRR